MRRNTSGQNLAVGTLTGTIVLAKNVRRHHVNCLTYYLPDLLDGTLIDYSRQER